MAKIHGRLQSFQWNGSAVAGIVDASLNLERPAVETTSHDTGDAREFIQGRLSGTVDLTLRWDEADAVQSAMQTDFFAGTSRATKFRMQTAGGAHSLDATGLITSWAPSGPNDDAGEVSVSIQLSGTITENAQ